MFKKFTLTLYTLWHHLLQGLHNADKKAFAQADGSPNDNGGGIEVQDEQNSVYKDLLKGEVTQEVVELRHEMYQSERKSHEYEYAGNGRVKKKSIFNDFNNVFCEDGYEVQLLHMNSEDTGTLSENFELGYDGSKDKRDFSFSIERDFAPRFRIEKYANKLVIERKGNDVIIDIYVTKYRSQFDRVQRSFINEVESIIKGNTKSDVIDFDNLKFTSFKTVGSDDFKNYMYVSVSYYETVEHEGDFIIRFNGVVAVDGDDMLDEFYSEEAQRKSDNHEARHSGTTIDFQVVADTMEDEKYDVDTASSILEAFMKNKKNG